MASRQEPEEPPAPGSSLRDSQVTMAQYPGQLRPRAAARKQHSGLLENAKAKVAKVDDFREVQAKTNPLDTERLMQAELQARMEYGKARRERQAPPRIFLAMLGWGLARLARLRFMRALNLFFFRYGTVMAAGAAYMMFFSVAAILFAGFSVAGIIIGNNEEHQAWIIEQVQGFLPGFIGEGGLVPTSEAMKLFDPAGLNLTLAITVAVAVVTSLSWMHGLRSGIRSIWDRPLMAENVLVVKVRDLGLMLLIGLVVLTSAAVGLFSNLFIDEALDLIGWEARGLGSRLTRIASVLISLGLDMIVAVLLMRVASRLIMPVSALWQSALIAGIGASLLRLASTTLLQNYGGGGDGEPGNPIIASGGVVLGLFFYFYLFGLVYLVAASWGAVAASDRTSHPRHTT